MANPTFSILGSDTAIKGDVSSVSDLHIDGKVEGDIHCAALVQGETSEITGSIVARSAKLAGLITGTIDAGELVVLRTARIQGDVNYETLSIEPGAQVDGRFAARSAAVVPFAAKQELDPYAGDSDSPPALKLDSSVS